MNFLSLNFIIGIIEQYNEYSVWKILLDAYLIFVIVLFVVRIIFSSKKLINLMFISVFFLVVWQITVYLEIKSSVAMGYVAIGFPVVVLLVFTPEIRRALERLWKIDVRNETIVMGSENTKTSIVDAAMELSSKKIGALITIEKHNTLDQYADRAIMMNSQVSKELLINIFTPLTPLHDGAVIIRGDQILCAGAYFVLTEKEQFEKTMGSRHRAGLGISEVSDSLTIIVSEETGYVSIAIEGIILRINDRDKLMEYVNTFMK